MEGEKVKRAIETIEQLIKSLNENQRKQMLDYLHNVIKID